MKKRMLSTLVLSLAMTCSVAIAAESGDWNGPETQFPSAKGYTNITGGNTPYQNRTDAWTSNTGSDFAYNPAQSVDTTGAGYRTSGKDFTKQNLTRSRFVRKFLHGASFRQAILTNSNFRGANAINADFNGAMLMGSNFRWAKLHGADFSNADLTNVSFTGAKLQDAKFNKNTKFSHAFIPQKHGMIMVP